jgi:hypothetical protein
MGVLGALILIVFARAMIDLPPVEECECYSLSGEGIALVLLHEFSSVVSR